MSGLRRVHGVMGAGAIKLALADRRLALLLGGGVKFGSEATKRGCGALWSRGLSRCVTSWSSWLSLDTCLERLFICVVNDERNS